MSTPTSKAGTPSPPPTPAEAIGRAAADADAAWDALLAGHGDVRRLAGWLRGDPDVAAPPADAERLTLRVLAAGLLTLYHRRLLQLDGRIREHAAPGRALDL